jgi:alpha-tubulin suppressor-like RCC1 family protein
VYVTGQNALSRMGLGATTVDVNVPRLIPLTETVPMKDMFFASTNNGATWLLSRTGQLYACGEANTSGRGGGNSVIHELWMPWGETNTVKEVVHTTSDQHYVAGAQYPRMTTALLDNGDLYMWGEASNSGGGYGTGYVGAVLPSNSALHPYKVNEGVVTATSKSGGYHTSLCLMDDGSIQHSGHSQSSIAPANVTTWTTLDPAVFNNGTKLLMQGSQYVATASLLRSDGQLIIWGDGQGGRLGIGFDGDTIWTPGNASYPQPIKLEKTVVDFQPVGYSTPDTTSAGMQILTSDGGVYFVGTGNSSVNGDDDGQYSAVPRQIIF